MKSIRFNHEYEKMPRGYENSKILEVFLADSDELHGGFVEYDTKIVDGGHYRLGSGLFIVLLLKTDGGKLWTTMRRWSFSKEQYYRGLRGTYISCEVIR